MNFDYGDVAFRHIEEIEKNPNKYIYVYNCGYINIHNNSNVFSEGAAPGYLLIYLHKGSLKVLIDNNYVQVSAGHVLIFRPKQIRDIVYESCNENERFFVYFQGVGVENYLKQLSLNDQIVYNTGELSFLIKTFKEIIQDFKIHNFDCDAYRTTMLLSILTTVSTRISNINNPKENYSNNIKNILRLMEQTYYCNYPLEYYAKESAQSIPSFIRNFKNETGVSPKKYLNSLKIEKAKMFLSTTNLSVTTIALNLGMDDPFYFCNFFKKNTGKSPSEYRNKSTNANHV